MLVGDQLAHQALELLTCLLVIVLLVFMLHKSLSELFGELLENRGLNISRIASFLRGAIETFESSPNVILKIWGFNVSLRYLEALL